MRNCLSQLNFFRPAGVPLRAGKIYQWGLLFVLVSLLAGCTQATPAQPGVAQREETMSLPTGVPTSKPTPVSTRVISVTVLTPSPAPSLTPLPDNVRALVVDVLDGDTISVVLEGDSPTRAYTVRYLGVDAPPNTPSVAWGRVAFEANGALTKGQVVRLERDQSDVDDQGNLLRYVYLGDELLNVTLTEQGLVRANISAPDTRFQAEILEAEQKARDGKVGLWGPLPTSTPPLAISPTAAITATRTTTATIAAPQTVTPQVTSTTEATAEPDSSPSATTEPN